MISCCAVILHHSYNHIRNVWSEEGEPLNKFGLSTMNNDDYSNFLKRVEARGLENINDNNEEPKVITSFEDIQSTG